MCGELSICWTTKCEMIWLPQGMKPPLMTATTTLLRNTKKPASYSTPVRGRLLMRMRMRSRRTSRRTCRRTSRRTRATKRPSKEDCRDRLPFFTAVAPARVPRNYLFFQVNDINTLDFTCSCIKNISSCFFFK